MSTFLDSARHRMSLVEGLLRNRGPVAPPESLEAFSRRAADAFEKDMQPVTSAIVAALKAGDVAALKGLRALLPHLLEQVNADPSLSGLLAQQLGKELLAGFMGNKNAEAAETQRGDA